MKRERSGRERERRGEGVDPASFVLYGRVCSCVHPISPCIVTSQTFDSILPYIKSKQLDQTGKAKRARPNGKATCQVPKARPDISSRYPSIKRHRVCILVQLILSMSVPEIIFQTSICRCLFPDIYQFPVNRFHPINSRYCIRTVTMIITSTHQS